MAISSIQYASCEAEIFIKSMRIVSINICKIMAVPEININQAHVIEARVNLVSAPINNKFVHFSDSIGIILYMLKLRH